MSNFLKSNKINVKFEREFVMNIVFFKDYDNVFSPCRVPYGNENCPCDNVQSKKKTFYSI
jgi:hypothetical protein